MSTESKVLIAILVVVFLVAAGGLFMSIKTYQTLSHRPPLSPSGPLKFHGPRPQRPMRPEGLSPQSRKKEGRELVERILERVKEQARLRKEREKEIAERLAKLEKEVERIKSWLKTQKEQQVKRMFQERQEKEMEKWKRLNGELRRLKEELRRQKSLVEELSEERRGQE